MQSVQRQSNMYGLLREKDHPTYKCNDGVYEYIHCNAKTGTETNVRRVTPGISCNITEN
jgi:N-methylhydantoinase B/oxoprolinase/acetone carboxylase alpha subunit